MSLYPLSSHVFTISNTLQLSNIPSDQQKRDGDDGSTLTMQPLVLAPLKSNAISREQLVEKTLLHCQERLQELNGRRGPMFTVECPGTN